ALRASGFSGDNSLDIPQENQFSPRLSTTIAACRRRIGQRAKKWLKLWRRIRDWWRSANGPALVHAARASFNPGPDGGQPLDGARWLGFRDIKLVPVMRAGGWVAPASARAKIIWRQTG